MSRPSARRSRYESDAADRLRDILDCIRRARHADRILQEGDEPGDGELVETGVRRSSAEPLRDRRGGQDLPEELLALAPEIGWKAVKGLGDVLGHEYFRIVAKVVHATVRENLDPLETAVIMMTAKNWRPTFRRERERPH